MHVAWETQIKQDKWDPSNPSDPSDPFSTFTGSITQYYAVFNFTCYMFLKNTAAWSRLLSERGLIKCMVKTSQEVSTALLCQQRMALEAMEPKSACIRYMSVRWLVGTVWRSTLVTTQPSALVARYHIWQCCASMLSKSHRMMQFGNLIVMHRCDTFRVHKTRDWLKTGGRTVSHRRHVSQSWLSTLHIAAILPALVKVFLWTSDCWTFKEPLERTL